MLGALSFLTIFGRSRVPGPGDVAWFPFVGLLLGLVLGGAWAGAGEVWPPLLAATLVVTLDLVLTGMLHLDGLADAADGLLPHMERERRLEVMREPGVGAFGTGVVVAVLGLRVAALASVEPEAGLLAVLWGLSRGVMASSIALVGYARTEGLATVFEARAADRWMPLGAIGVSLGALGLWGVDALAACAATVLAGAAVVWLGKVRVGGYTGDVLGAAGMVAETVGLVVLAAKW